MPMPCRRRLPTLRTKNFEAAPQSECDDAWLETLGERRLSRVSLDIFHGTTSLWFGSVALDWFIRRSLISAIFCGLESITVFLSR